jgi:hypothetical protein
VPEVGTVACADLDHPTSQADEQLAAVLDDTEGILVRTLAGVCPSEQGGGGCPP